MIQPAWLSKGRPIKARVNKLRSANECQICCVDAHFVIFCVWAISRTSVRCSLASTVYHKFRFGPLSLWATAQIASRLPAQHPCSFQPFSICIPVPSLRRLQRGSGIGRQACARPDPRPAYGHKPRRPQYQKGGKPGSSSRDPSLRFQSRTKDRISRASVCDLSKLPPQPGPDGICSERHIRNLPFVLSCGIIAPVPKLQSVRRRV